MQTRQLGKDGPQVSAVCLGAMVLDGRMGHVPEDQATATVHAAIDSGMTFIDTAENYTTSQEEVGKALVGRRDQVFLATKLSEEHSKEHIAEALEDSLRKLRTDHVDLYYLHYSKPEWPIEDTMGELMKYRDQGKLRYIGISNFTAAETAEAASHAPIAANQPRYSLLFREAGEELLPRCEKLGIGVCVYSPLAKGLLTGYHPPGFQFTPGDQRLRMRSFLDEEMSQTAYELTQRLGAWASDHGRNMVQLAIAWTLANPAVTAALVGAKSPEQVVNNAAAADWVLSDADLAEIDELTAGVRFTGRT